MRAAGHPMKVRSAARLHGTLPGASPSRTAVLRAPPSPAAPAGSARPDSASRSHLYSTRKLFPRSRRRAARTPGTPQRAGPKPSQRRAPRLPHRQQDTARRSARTWAERDGPSPISAAGRGGSRSAPSSIPAGRAQRWGQPAGGGAAPKTPSAPPSPDPINGPCSGRWGLAAGGAGGSPSGPGSA